MNTKLKKIKIRATRLLELIEMCAPKELITREIALVFQAGMCYSSESVNKHLDELSPYRQKDHAQKRDFSTQPIETHPLCRCG